MGEFVECFSVLIVCGVVKIVEVFFEVFIGEFWVCFVVIGNWGCGVFRGDLEFKVVI